MPFELLNPAQARCRAARAPHLVALVRAGATAHLSTRRPSRSPPLRGKQYSTRATRQGRKPIMKIVKAVEPPAGFTRALFRLPIHLYRLRLGWLFGNRLLLLNHIGRVSGKAHQTVLEVAEHDTTDDSYTVASGWGPTAAWYRNILHNTNVSIQVGTRTISVTAVPLSKEQGGDIFSRYAARHRRAAKFILPRVLGFSVDGSDNDFRAVGERLPFVRFVPCAPE